jgi:hypothetical protein
MSSSSNASNISSAKYGYDFVVATTQASINGTMLAFLSALKEPEVITCYCADPTDKPVPIDYEVLKQKANGTDPFLVPSGTDTANDPNIKNLLGARFMVGFKARLGVPHVSKPSLLPDVVTLGGDTSSVIFNMLCSEFIVVELDPDSLYSSPSWTNLSQPANSPWAFTSKVDLHLSTVDGSAYSTLAPAIQSAIKNLGVNAFSVQQLLFDLTNASLMTVPNLSGVTPGTTLSLILLQYFISAYFNLNTQDLTRFLNMV